MGLMTSSKGIYFTLDALFAAILIISGFLFISSTIVDEEPEVHLHYLSSDLLVALDNIPVVSINNSFISTEIANGGITNLDNSILEQIAAYWAQNETLKAEKLANISLEKLVPPTYGLRLSMDPDLLYEHPNTAHSSIIVGRRMISGVEKGRALEGSSSVGYLRTIHDKDDSSYGYFGGFVGQGNITIQLEEIPDDVNSSRVKDIVLEADLKKPFSVYINGVWCANLTPSIGNLSADLWHLSSCNGSISSGRNNFSLHFKSFNNAYVGGGYVRVDYETDTFQINRTYDVIRYDFPSILGIVNLFDAINVPGTMNAMTIYLHYLANHTNMSTNTFYFTVGNTTVYTDLNSTNVTSVSLSNTQLSTMLNYTLFSNTTVPIRLGFENLTYDIEFVGSADVVIITDVSGSMDWNFTHDYSSSTRRNCDDSHIYDLSTQRLSVAKCLDKDFSTNILNVSGNRIGLVSYESSTDSQLPLTTNLTDIYTEIGMGVGVPVGYVASGSTCICCGINSASDLLSGDILMTTVVSSRSEWNYTNQSMKGSPTNDAENRTWFDPDYALESSWMSGDAVLGHDHGGGGVAIDTEMGHNLTGIYNVPDMWEMAADLSSPEVDFISGLNSTANTYGAALANDGWDWSDTNGPFGFNTVFDYFGVWNQELLMRVDSGTNRDSSGAFAVSINITDELFAILNTSGVAELSFEYWWDDYNNYFENNDQVWVKARWTSPYSGSHWLGDDLDGGHNHRDDTPEIDTRDNPNLDITNGFYSTDMGSVIEGPGLYYLEIGGKLDRSASNEWGYFGFDNILLTFNNKTNFYYLRKHFELGGLTAVQRGVLNVLADDKMKVYLNGNLVLDGRTKTNGTYWDYSGVLVKGSYFRLGDNVLAVELQNSASNAAFDLELLGANDSQQKTMLVMTDGVANVECSRQGWTPDLDGDGTADTARDDAIAAACEAAADFGAVVYSVGFSENADEPTLAGMASCGNGVYGKSSNASQLGVFYQDVVLNILEVARQSQSVVVASGAPLESELYPDSYILINHSQTVRRPEPNEIELVFQTDQFSDCTSEVVIPQGLRVSEARVTSYSGDHWTSLVELDDVAVFNLSEYSANYSQLGDPYAVQIPAYLLTSGPHNITILTGDDDRNTTGCSQNNTLIYRGYVNSSTSRSSVVELSDGCNWTVEFEDGAVENFLIPPSYSGPRVCSYTNASISYNTLDAYDLAVYTLLSSLDFDRDGRVLINLVAEDLEIIVTLISDVPYLWGPAIMEVELWQ